MLNKRVTTSASLRSGFTYIFVSLASASLCSLVLAASSDESADNTQATAAQQTLLDHGRIRFAADCGFCHGRDAQGGSGGADLTRSELVAADTDGELIAEVIRRGRPDKGMPPFASISANDVQALVAYIHQQTVLAKNANGGRRSVLPEDLAVGNADNGRQYFNTNCSECHSATGDLADINSRYQGLGLLQRMLYPGSESRSNKPRPTLTVITADGQRLSGTLSYQDEFTVAMLDTDGRHRSWFTDQVDIIVNDRLAAHEAMLANYTDNDMHDVYAFLLTLSE